MSFWTAWWITLAVLGTATDIIAATNRTKGDTLSEHIWSAAKHRWFRIALLWFLSWAVIHLLTGGWV